MTNAQTHARTSAYATAHRTPSTAHALLTHTHSPTGHPQMSVADPTTERYATIMDSLISDCTRLEDQVAELGNQLRATAQERDAAQAAQTAAERERDQAVQDLEDIEGTFGEEDPREYCEVCNHHWHRDYVTWFAHPFETEDGRHVNSACGGCFRQVPVGHGPVV